MPVIAWIAIGILLLALALLVIAIYLAVAVAIIPVAAAAGAAALAMFLLWTYLHAAQQVLAPRPAPADDSRIRLPPSTGEPAYRSYYAGQLTTDMQSVVREAWKAGRKGLRSPAVRGVRRWLLTGRPQPGLPLRHLDGALVLLTCPAGIGLSAGAVAGALVALTVASAIQLVHALFLALITASLALSGIALQAADTCRLAVRRIHMKCPHPNCYKPITRPYYRCSSGQHEHRSLRPGLYGVLWRTCACGERLPTMFVFKLHRLNAWCPRCSRPVPSGLGSAPLIHLPLIGGSSAGKTALLTAIVDSLERLPQRDKITVEFASDVSRADYESARALLHAGDWPNATAAYVPHAFLIYVRKGRSRRRLIYLYDPRGEVFHKEDTVREQEYLESADGVIFVIDPFSAPAARHLPPGDEPIGQAARPAPIDPDKTYASAAGELRTVLGSRHRRTPVAVVATKMDALEKTRTLPAPQNPRNSASVAEWLGAIGLGNLTRSLGHDFADVQYWATSAYTSARPSSTDDQRRNVAASLLWLLTRA